MRLPNRSGKRGFSFQFTSMIDVIFLLLVFFICTSSFTKPERTLPSPLSEGGIGPPDPTQIEEELPPEPILIDLHWVNATPVWVVSEMQRNSLQEVRSVLAGIAQNVDPETPIILDIDDAVPMLHTINLFDTCRSVGLTNVQYAAGG